MRGFFLPVSTCLSANPPDMNIILTFSIPARDWRRGARVVGVKSPSENLKKAGAIRISGRSGTDRKKTGTLSDRSSVPGRIRLPHGLTYPRQFMAVPFT